MMYLTMESEEPVSSSDRVTDLPNCTPTCTKKRTGKGKQSVKNPKQLRKAASHTAKTDTGQQKRKALTNKEISNNIKYIEDVPVDVFV